MFPITDARPGLAVDDEPLAWWSGGPALLLASARAVRVNFRGVYAIGTALRGDLEQDGWVRAPCNESAHALCASENGAVFPAQAPRVASPPAVLADGWRGLQCAQSGGKVLVPQHVYDISACDVLDEGLDVIFARGQLYVHRSALTTLEYVLFVVLCVALVRCLSFNVQALLTRAPPPGDQWIGFAATAAVFGLACHRTDAPYVTEQDRAFYWASLAYVGLYLGLYAAEVVASVAEHAQPAPFFNLLVGALQLACLRFYRSADTPYALVLIGMLSARTWLKLRLADRRDAALPRRWAWTSRAGLLLDALYVSLQNAAARELHGLTLIPVHVAGFVFSELVPLDKASG